MACHPQAVPVRGRVAPTGAAPPRHEGRRTHAARPHAPAGQDALDELTAANEGPPTTPLWRARHDAIRSTSLLVLTRLDEARQVAEQAHAAGKSLPDATAVAHAMHTLSLERSIASEYVASREYLDRALAATADAPELGDLRLMLLGNRFSALKELGQFAGVCIF